MTDQQQLQSEPPWYAAYPQARSNPETISRSKLLASLKQSAKGGKIALVDLRRTDYEVRIFEIRCVSSMTAARMLN